MQKDGEEGGRVPLSGYTSFVVVVVVICEAEERFVPFFSFSKKNLKENYFIREKLFCWEKIVVPAAAKNLPDKEECLRSPAFFFAPPPVRAPQIFGGGNKTTSFPLSKVSLAPPLFAARSTDAYNNKGKEAKEACW